MRYRLRTLLILLTVVPPLIGFWPDIMRHAITRAAQITASDVAVIAAASTLVAMRVRLHFLTTAKADRPSDDSLVS